MATLIKYTFSLRNVKLISYYRHNLSLVNTLSVRTLCAVRNCQIYAWKCTNQPQSGQLTNALLGNVPRIHTTSSCLAEKKEPCSCPEDEIKKLSLFKRFKAMYRDYWYVLVPVHLITSALWFAGFYYAAKSGIDIVTFMETLHFSESLISKVKEGAHSTTGYLAIAYALYKIFTPLRYTVTLGGTTVSINYLKKWGYIKPMIKGKELQKILVEKRDTFRERKLALKEKVLCKINQKKS